MSVRTVLLLAAAAVALCACGKQGKLERPPPLWGSPAATPTPAEDKKTDRPVAPPTNPTPTP